MWDGARVVGVVPPGRPDPVGAELDVMEDLLASANCGVRPSIRVVEEFHLTSFSDDRMPDPCDGKIKPRGMPPKQPGR